MAQGLSEDQVRHAKNLLLQGVAPIQIARLMECSVETIRRYKRGESRAKVVVEGEESLRPKLNIEPVPQAQATQEATPEGAEESLAKLLAGLPGLSRQG